MQTLDASALVPGVAFDLFKAGQPLGAAIVYANLLRAGVSSAELYCGLGSGLLDSRGVLVRKPFEEWAAKVFARGASTFPGTPYANVVRDRLAQIPPGTPSTPLRDAEIPALIEFLVVNESVLPDAIEALPEEDRMTAVMALGERPDPLYVPVLCAAIVGRYGDGAARSALKRVGAFLDRADVQAALAMASESPMAEELQPYLGFVLQRLPAGWDAPRTQACPPYEGVGTYGVELTGVGSARERVVEILRTRLGASLRDARSWVDFAPCVIKRGATRADAFTLLRELGEVGATVQVPGLLSAAATSAPAAKKPWWRFW